MGTVLRAKNLAKRLEKQRISKEAMKALQEEYNAKKFARQVQPGDADLLMAEF